eukprot:3077594-Alexandrium_andersonii.AAC.1
MPGRACHGKALSVHEWPCAGSRRSGRTDQGPRGDGYCVNRSGSGPGCTPRGQCEGAGVGRSHAGRASP